MMGDKVESNGDIVDGGPRSSSGAHRCTQLYLEAVKRGVRINGKLCNAVMLGFGSDLAVSAIDTIIVVHICNT